jgi:hypothetical protein
MRERIRNKRLERYISRIVTIGLIVYCTVDIVNYYIIFKNYGITTTFVRSKKLSGTARNKHWVVEYDYFVDPNRYDNTITDFTPFSNTYKNHAKFYVYFYKRKTKKHIILPYKVNDDFSPSFRHYLKIDRNAVFFLKISLFILFIKLIPLIWSILYTIVGVFLIVIFRPIKYKRFIDKRKKKIYDESIGRIVNKIECYRY